MNSAASSRRSLCKNNAARELVLTDLRAAFLFLPEFRSDGYRNRHALIALHPRCCGCPSRVVQGLFECGRDGVHFGIACKRTVRQGKHLVARSIRFAKRADRAPQVDERLLSVDRYGIVNARFDAPAVQLPKDFVTVSTTHDKEVIHMLAVRILGRQNHVG